MIDDGSFELSVLATRDSENFRHNQSRYLSVKI